MVGAFGAALDRPAPPGRWLRPLAAIAFVLAFGYFAGIRPVILFTEFKCPSGYVQRPVGLIGGVYACQQPGPIPADEVGVNPTIGGTTQRELGLFLANLHVRLFDFNFEQDNYLWFAVGVP